MFESTNFDLDDVVLETSFTPPSNSTQLHQISPSFNSQAEETPKKVICDEKSTILSEPNRVPIQNEVCRVVTSSVSKTMAELALPEDTFISPNRVLKRKFPGPAGLLPDSGASNKSILQFLENEHLNNENTKDVPILSQQTNSVFEDGPWKEMSKDFHVQGEESLLQRFNINWIKKQALKQLLHHKAPFLAAVIQNLDILDGKIPTVNVTLKDSSGDIGGTILHSLYEQYSNFFGIGSVIVLKHFGVLSAGYKNHCLTITPNNLISIYCPDKLRKFSEKDEERTCSQSTCVAVKKIVIQECNNDEILKKYNKDVELYLQEKQKMVNLGSLKRSCSREVESATSLKNSFPVKKRLSPYINQNATTNGLNMTSITFTRSNMNAIQEQSLPKNPVKNKFNFKQVHVTNNCKTLVNSNSENVKFTGTSKSSQEINNCDNIVISSSQISVKPDQKEHVEIWKNLLEDVDTDSLFDDF